MVTNDILIRCAEGLTTGISFFMRFRMFDLAGQGGSERTLWEKTDNDPLTDGMRVVVTSAGRLGVTIKRSGIDYAWETASATIVINTVYDLWITFTQSDKSIRVYINNVLKTLTTRTPSNFHTDLTNKDYSIFVRGQGTLTGLVYGDLYEFRVHREKIMSATDISRIWTNKLTTANIPFRQVIISNYWCSVA
jgi:hypothetical protein